MVKAHNEALLKFVNMGASHHSESDSDEEDESPERKRDSKKDHKNPNLAKYLN